MRKLKMLLSMAPFGLSLLVLSAKAQDSATPPPPPAVSDAEAPVEEVIVTARKRNESILKVPVIETALGEQQLQQFGTADLHAVATQVPDLLFGSTVGAFGAQVSLRGIGTSTLNAAIDQSVSLNLDGMQISQGLAYASGMFDVAQVEVLKGPQALFYGKASPGGVISLHSADPTNEFEFITQGGYEFEARQKKGQVIVSGPVGETLKLRLAASVSDMDGFYRNDAVGLPSTGGVTPRFRNFAPVKEYLVRGTAVWHPIERYDAKLKMNFAETDMNGDGGGEQYSSCPGPTSNVFGIPFISPDEDCKVDRHLRIVDLDPAAFPGIRNGGTPFSDVRQVYGTIEQNFHIRKDVTLTSVTGGYAVRQENMINGTITEEAGTPLVADNNFYRRDFTQELRLASDFSSPVNFTLGGFYQNGIIHNGINLLGNTFLGLPPLLQKGTDKVGIHSVSAFGQATWKIVPKLELAGGARWTYEGRPFTQLDDITGTATQTPVAVPFISSYHISPEASLTYTPTDTLTLFGSFKEASKSGSFDTTTIIAAGTDNSFRDEGSRGGEVGIKAALLDRSLRLDLAAYHYSYKDLQVGTNIVSPQGAVTDLTLNAATAKVYGLDMDANYRVAAVRGLDVHGGLNWNHARFGTFDAAPCWGGQTISEGCNQQLNPVTDLYTAQNLSGRPLVRAPDLSANFGFSYARSVGKGMILTLGSNTSYSSKYYTNLILRDDTYQKSYFKADASLALSAADERWEFAVIGNDLNNELTTGNCINAPFSNGIILGSGTSGGETTNGPVDQIACNFDRGRQVMMRVTLRPLALLKL